MFGTLKHLSKALVGTVVQTPIAVVADVFTLGGALNDTKQPYTAEAMSKVMDNVKKATK